jgi:2'-5' RNA ligase
MPGIVLTFDKKYNKNIINLYKNINKNFSKEIILINKIPHISLMRIQSDFNKKTIKDINNGLNNFNMENINIKIKGIGIFKKDIDKYVLFFIPDYDIAFQKIHNKIWDIFGNKLDLLQKEYYSPKSYSPHLTIPIKEPTKKNIMNILDYLLDSKTKFSLETKSIVFLNTSKKTKKTLIHVKKNLINL